ncbi:MAG: hypothetical protein NT075_08405 [Chloroflexi bacterium]|nr:hypothetical protein [Chloroflexota bacterium]
MTNTPVNLAITASLAHGQAAPTSALTAELVRAVTEKVYALWLLELKLERERWRNSPRRGFYSEGGW